MKFFPSKITISLRDFEIRLNSAVKLLFCFVLFLFFFTPYLGKSIGDLSFTRSPVLRSVNFDFCEIEKKYF